MQTTTAIQPKRRQGFTDIRRQDRDLYIHIVDHVRMAFDRCDWGYLHACGNKVRANKKDTLNLHLSRLIPKERKTGAKRIRDISLTRIESHCEGHSTLYTTSNPVSGYAVLLLDIDDKDGTAGDAHQVFDLIASFFAYGCSPIYGQISTFGKGYHGYLMIDYRGQMKGQEFRKLCKSFARSLVAAVSDHGFKSAIELKGVPGAMLPHGGFKTCGSLAKFPRLSTAQHWRDYLSSPIFNSSALQSFIDLYPTPEPEPKTKKRKTPARLFPSVMNSGTDEECSTIHYGEREASGGIQCPVERMNTFARSYSRELHRPASETELLVEYERRGLNTGEDQDGSRAHLARTASEWIASTWEPSRFESFDSRKPMLDQLIAQHVTIDIRQTIRKTNRSAYTDEQMAVVLYTIERASLTTNPNSYLQGTTPNNGLAVMMSKTGVEIDLNEETQIKKLRAIKTALLMSGLVAERNHGRWCQGKAKAFTLGANHPSNTSITREEQP